MAIFHCYVSSPEGIHHVLLFFLHDFSLHLFGYIATFENSLSLIANISIFLYIFVGKNIILRRLMTVTEKWSTLSAGKWANRYPFFLSYT